MVRKVSTPNLLLFSVLVVATCGLIYELIAGTLASYLLGDSVTQFSIIIGVYLFSMGIGSWLSKYFERNLLSWFIQIEILVGLVGGFSSSALFILFEFAGSFQLVLYGLVMLTGILVGLEIPLIMRILKDEFDFTDLVSRVFTFDYIGALVASLVFPLVLVPFLGLVKTSFLFGILNVGVAIALCIQLKHLGKWFSVLKRIGFAALIILVAGFILSEKIVQFSESLSYAEPVIFAKSSPYQRIVLTRNRKELRLYLNGNLQFSSADEYRYHEALVHPVMQQLKDSCSVLILGGGDGLALREILRYSNVKKVDLVDLDEAVTHLFSSNSLLTDLNQNSLSNPKVSVHHKDAFQWLKTNTKAFDAIIIDFPDPGNYSVGKLYTQTFYKLLKKSMQPKTLVVVQSTSPLVAPKSFWCVNQTMESVGLQTLPYHAFVPSFGEWGFILASFDKPSFATENISLPMRFLTNETIKTMSSFSADMSKQTTEVNKLNNQILVHYFEKEWAIYQ
ncbi:MAG: spermidine synthase [Bacteroidetes bacterium B1(2017)]|nr:MAG: spermidine synthase [Bacteroidetes bacterium B1(2017)]